MKIPPSLIITHRFPKLYLFSFIIYFWIDNSPTYRLTFCCREFICCGERKTRFSIWNLPKKWKSTSIFTFYLDQCMGMNTTISCRPWKNHSLRLCLVQGFCDKKKIKKLKNLIVRDHWSFNFFNFLTKFLIQTQSKEIQTLSSITQKVVHVCIIQRKSFFVLTISH